MPRKRTNKTDNWLPSRVYRGKVQYEYRPKEGGCIKLGKILRNEDGSPIENDEVKARIFSEHAKEKASKSIREDLSWLISLYMGSVQWKDLSASERGSDALRLKRITPVFGKMMPRDITPGHLRAYMDKLGETKKPSANRDHGFMSRLFNWSIERNYLKFNPAEKVKKFQETPRSRYIEDWEYDLVYEVAKKSTYKWIAPLMELAYLCRIRDNEVRSMTEDFHIREEGIFVERGKGSKNEITAWSPRLREAVDDARVLAYPNAPVKMKERPLFKNRSGNFITASSRKTGWRRVREQAMESGLVIDGIQVLLKESFTFHDIKAKGITDHENKEGGHRSKKMEAVYDRKPSIIKATR